MEIAVALVACLILLTGTSAIARSPMALGLSEDPAVSRDMSFVDAVIAETGATPALWSLWSTWGSRGGQGSCTPSGGTCAFPSQAAAGLEARGITPMIWWKPTDPANRAKGRYERYIRIIKGRHDPYIRQWALDAKAHGGPIVLRFAHEANGHWYPWGLAQLDNTPWRFKQAWRHVWRIFRDLGASNVRFLWNPIEEGCAGCIPDFRYESFYPGNKYVDYVGINAFNWGWRRWQPLTEILKPSVKRMRQLTGTRSLPRGKPIIVGELSSNHVNGNKASWLRTGYRKTFERWPKVKALVYLDVDMRHAGQPDWRLIKPANGSALRAYVEIAAKPKFRGAIR
jgi:hypothetical protein